MSYVPMSPGGAGSREPGVKLKAERKTARTTMLHAGMHQPCSNLVLDADGAHRLPIAISPNAMSRHPGSDRASPHLGLEGSGLLGPAAEPESCTAACLTCSIQ